MTTVTSPRRKAAHTLTLLEVLQDHLQVGERQSVLLHLLPRHRELQGSFVPLLGDDVQLFLQ